MHAWKKMPDCMVDCLKKFGVGEWMAAMTLLDGSVAALKQESAGDVDALSVDFRWHEVQSESSKRGEGVVVCCWCVWWNRS